ncbi:unnamed protein product [Pedinophyceae sp. YPF-701]|nr:unnamed protein product [Pedinophyceae sp. YPF-701]
MPSLGHMSARCQGLAAPRSLPSTALRSRTDPNRLQQPTVHAPGRRQVKAYGLFGLGVPELVVIGGIAALVFGPSKLPELGKQLGKSVKSFQEATDEFQKELKDEREEKAKKEADAKKEEKKPADKASEDA